VAIAVLTLLVAAPLVVHAQAPERPVLPREQVQALIRSALQNPADTAALNQLEAALPAATTSTTPEGGRLAGTLARAATAATAFIGAAGSGLSDLAAAIPLDTATTTVLAVTLLLSLALLVLIRRRLAVESAPRATPPLAAARELTRSGAPTEQVVQQTGVSRDVVEMMLRLRGPDCATDSAPATDAALATDSAPAPAAGAAAPGPPPRRSRRAAPKPVVFPGAGSDLRHLAGGAAAYTALDRKADPVPARQRPDVRRAPAAETGPAPRAPASRRPADAAPQRTTLRFTYADLPEPGTSDGNGDAMPRGGGRIDPDTRLGGMIGDLFGSAAPPRRGRR
jgi:hypothetical protein